MSQEPDLDALLVRLREAQARDASEEELASIRKAITAAGNREAAARQKVREEEELREEMERFNRIAPGAQLADHAATLPEFTATPQIQSLMDRFRTALRDSAKLAPHVDALMARVEPSIVLQMSDGSSTSHMSPAERARKEQSLPLGASRFGFVPDLPTDMPWPAHQGKKLPFLAQLDLAEFPRWSGSPLPEDGWLYAFASFPLQIKGDDLWRYAMVYHRGPREALVRQPQESTFDNFLPTWNEEPCFDLVTFKPRVSIDIDPALLEGIAGWKHTYQLAELLDKVGGFSNDRYGDIGAAGHLLGKSGDFSEETATDTLNTLIRTGLHPVPLRVARRPGGPGSDWIHLFSLRSVGSMEWCDSGFIYFIIRRSDLLARRFEDAVLSLCTS
jgi:uncharacterized protein YwqG